MRVLMLLGIALGLSACGSAPEPTAAQKNEALKTEAATQAASPEMAETLQ